MLSIIKNTYLKILRYISTWLNRYKERICKCPYCFSSFTWSKDKKYLCPICAEHIPPSIIHSQAKVISIVGPKNSSKTTYLTLLAFGLQKGVMLFEKEGITCSIVGSKEAKRTLEQNIEMMLVEEELVLGTTDLGSTLLIQIGVSRGNSTKNIFLSFRDYQGESMEDFDEFLNKSNIMNASGVIYLFDPMYSPAFVKKLEGSLVRGKKVKLEPNLILNSNYTTHINRLYDALLANGSKSILNQKINIPISVAITKFDLLEKILGTMATPDPDSFAFFEKSAFINQLNNYSNYLEYQVYRSDPKFITLIRRYFKRYQLFALSPLGFDPDSTDTTISGKKIKSTGLFNPLIWMLKELNFI